MLKSKRIVIFPLLLALLALGACKGKGIDAPEELAPITGDEALAFSEVLSKGLHTCDKAALHDLIDMNSMMRRATRQSAAKGRQEQEVLKGMRTSGTDLRSQFCGAPSDSNGLHFLRVHKRDGKEVLLYRSIVDESLNYIEFHAGKSADGRIKVDNIYIYMTGQTLVETLAQMIDVLIGNDSVVKALEDINEQIASDPAAALRILEALPKKALKAKPMQLLKIQAASSLDDATYEAAITEYEKLYPNDPSLNLVSLDGLIMRKNYQDALKALDKLETSLGGDSYLNDVRIGLLLEEGKDLERATTLAEEALKAAPESEDAHYLLLGVHVTNRNFAGAVATMRLMGERFELVFEDDGLDPSDANYMALKASPEWAAYKSKLSEVP